MQKTNIKWSILIWAIFLSLIISVTFISISTKINKNLKNNNTLTSNIEIKNEINNIINSWSLNNIFKSQYLSNWDKLIFSDSNKSIIWLKEWEIHISKVNEDSNIAIDILIWWPVTYKIESQSWIIITRKALWVTTWKDLIIENLWWYTKIKITSDVITNFLSKNTNYKILRKIWNKEIVISKWQIKNF